MIILADTFDKKTIDFYTNCRCILFKKYSIYGQYPTEIKEIE